MANRRKTIYTGVTTALETRVWEHKTKAEDGFTARYGIDRLVYFEHTNSIHDAIAREKQIKGWTRSKKVVLIESMNPAGRTSLPIGTRLLHSLVRRESRECFRARVTFTTGRAAILRSLPDPHPSLRMTGEVDCGFDEHTRRAALESLAAAGAIIEATSRHGTWCRSTGRAAILRSLPRPHPSLRMTVEWDCGFDEHTRRAAPEKPEADKHAWRAAPDGLAAVDVRARW